CSDILPSSASDARNAKSARRFFALIALNPVATRGATPVCDIAAAVSSNDRLRVETNDRFGIFIKLLLRSLECGVEPPHSINTQLPSRFASARSMIIVVSFADFVFGFVDREELNCHNTSFLEYDPTLHDPLHALELAHVFGRVSVNGDQVGVFAR